MSRNGSGTYTLPSGNPVVTGTTISSTVQNNTMSDIATALTQSLAYDGQTVPVANLPMGGYKLTGLGAATALTDAASLVTIQANTGVYVATVGGTADVITLTPSPALAAYAAGNRFSFIASGSNTTNVTVAVSGLAAKAITKNGSTALSAADIASGALITIIYDGTRFQLTNASSLPSTDNAINDFRLTLSTGVPVTTADVTGATTVYCTPYKGNRIALYDGSTAWNIRASAEFSLALGTLTSGKPYDVFCYDNSGTPTLEFLVWTNDTTRATALAYQDGVLVKSGATTRRYLGTFYTTATTTTEDSFAKRYLWNYYNRVKRSMHVYSATASWTYTTFTMRQANASATNQLAYVQGVSEDEVHCRVTTNATSSVTGGTTISVAVGVDSTSVPSGDWGAAYIPVGNNGNGIANYDGYPGVGAHILVWLEQSQAGGTTTWYGNGIGNNQGISGIVGELMG